MELCEGDEKLVVEISSEVFIDMQLFGNGSFSSSLIELSSSPIILQTEGRDKTDEIVRDTPQSCLSIFLFSLFIGLNRRCISCLWGMSWIGRICYLRAVLYCLMTSRSLKDSNGFIRWNDHRWICSFLKSPLSSPVNNFFILLVLLFDLFLIVYRILPYQQRFPNHHSHLSSSII